MRGKPSKPRHKESNTFKFQSFTERISNLKIDVFHHIKHVNEQDSDRETYFSQALEKWSLINCAESFKELQKEIKNIQTLPQIIKQKDHVSSILLKHLDDKNKLDLQPVLELIVSLAKDLRQDFYSCYQDFHKRLISLLDMHDPDVLEWTFHCLAYLFKFLWRYLITDLQTVLESFMPLLSSSKPNYINHFAAESFAFVARKIKDQKKFLFLTLKLLKKFPDGIDGCGRLLYEVVRGVNGRFHSCAETTLTVYLQFFNESGVTYKVFCDVITAAYMHIINGIHPNHCDLLWKTLQDALSKALSEPRSDHNVKTINFILNIIKFGVENRSGALVKDADSLSSILIKIIQPTSNNNISSINAASEILSLLLMSYQVNLTQELASKILVSAMSYLKETTLLNFIKEILEYSGFDGLVLPNLLKYCSYHPIDVTLSLITKLVSIKSPPAQTSQDLMDWQPYSLNFPEVKQDNLMSYGEQLLEEISKCPCSMVSQIDKTSSCLLILPHICKIDRQKLIEKLKDSFNNLCLFLAENCQSCCKNCNVDISDKNLISKTLMAISFMVETIIKIRSDCPSKLVPPEVFLNGILKFSQSDEYISAIRALDFYITSDELNSVADFSSEIKEKIWLNLMSPFHKVRLLSIHILFELEKGCETGSNASLQILESCWLTELTPVTMTDYREKLKHVQRVETNCTLAKSSLSDSSYQPPVALFLGQLFNNFKLIWKPVCKSLACLAQTLPNSVFWPIFYSQLSRVSFIIREQSPPFKLEQIFTDENLSSIYCHLNEFNDRPDYINYRILLWNAMKEFSSLCELKNKDVVSEVITFIENEYLARNADLATNWNIVKSSQNDTGLNVTTDIDEIELEEDFEKSDKEDSSLVNTDDKMDVDEENEEDGLDIVNNDEINYEEEIEPETTYKWANRSLLAHLELLSKFNAPKSISRENELHKYYLEFLSHKQADIQKAALDCLLTYKDKFLTPYRQELYNLIDDNQFRHEINRFRISSQSDIIKSEHRLELIPIVLRIVYIKMLTGSSKGANSRYARRAAVIRFLGGCTPDELNSYFDMSFPFFIHHIKDDAVLMVKNIMDSIDLEKTIPPRRLQSMVDLLKTFVVHTGGLLDNNSLGRLFRLLMCHAACAVGALSQRQLVNASYVKTLKVIRARAIDTLIWFFDKFQEYPWTANEIDCIFHVFIWQWIEKFHQVSIKGPTPLLKLFSIWSQNPRYFIILSHWKEIDGKKISPLSSLMDLWLSKTHKSVNNVITDIVERMLTLTQSNEVSNEISLSRNPFYNSINFPQNAFNNLNFGSKLMICQASSVMEKLRKKLSEGNVIVGKELEIMSRITEIVMLMQKEENSVAGSIELAESLYSLLLPVLLKKSSAPEHVTTALLTSLRNLAMIIPSPGKYIKTLAPLFSKINGAVPRKLLVSLTVNSHKKGGSDCELNYKIVEGINAYNYKWLDQPDFDKRLESFKEIESLLEEQNISFDLGLIIIHTCFNFISVEKDLSLKNSSSQCLRSICPVLSKHFQETSGRHLFVDQTILSLINQGIRNKNEEFVRNESISLLGIMVRECAYIHPVLEDLKLLSDKEDLEKDFFENMQHLQHHRKLRAMVRFCETVKSYEKIPRARAMTQFVLPMVSFYLCNEHYVSRPTVVDCAAQALTAICKLLPWHQYFQVLKYYLEKMQKRNEFQKQLVRINIDILNSFHFDLSSAENGSISLTNNLIEKENDENNQLEEPKSSGDQNTENGNDLEEENDLIADISEDVDNEDEEMELEVEQNVSSETNILEQVSVLSRSNANKVIKVIRDDLIRKLLRALSQRTLHDSSHKTNRKHSIEDKDQQDMISIPLAIAIVKLLQKLPSQFLQNHLSGVIMKVVSYLKSRLESVRRVARKTLQEIAVSLGPSSLCHLVQEMTPLLTRGFHVHVLAYTIHSILISLKPHFKQGDIDSAVPHILEVCKMDLFGDCSEEKEVDKIVGKLLEARSSKSFSSFNIMAQFITEKYLLDLILPLKETLSETLVAKTIGKVSECLRQVCLGLVENQYITDESLVLFAFGTASESIPSLLPQEEALPDPKIKIWESRRNADSFLIPQEPKRQKSAEVKACAQSNSHILVEFGLRLLYVLLRRERLKDHKFLPHLDPLIHLLVDCLKSKHVKISISAIQCLCWLLKYELPSLKEYINELTESLFAILHKYASSGLSKGDNFELVFITFKAMGVLVREVPYCKLSQDQMRALLMYCEQDLEDHSRQATAFSLLKAVLTGRVQSPELNEIMKKVASISVTALLDSVRVQARQVVHLYLMEYPLGKKLNAFLSFYYENLDYDLLHGRESVLTMLQTIIDTFPQGKLEDEASALFINLSARLVNDSSPECRKNVASIITSLLNKITKTSKDKLFEITQVWLEQHKESTRKLAVQIIGIFVSIEKEEFYSRLDSVLPFLVDQFFTNNNRPGKFVLLNRSEESNSSDEMKNDDDEDDICDDKDEKSDKKINKELIRDHLLFQTLQVLCKIITHMPMSLENEQYAHHWSAIIGYAHSLLCYPHEWVRLGSVQLLGLTLSTVQPHDLAFSINHPPEEESTPHANSLFSTDPKSVLRSITLDLLAQLTPDNELNEKFILQIMKLLVYIAEVLKELSSKQTNNGIEKEEIEEVSADVEDNKGGSLSLIWLVKRIRRVINGEIVHAPQSISVRTMCFNWIAAVAVKLDKLSVSSVGYHLVAPLARELSLCKDDDPLKKIAKEATQYLRTKIGHNEYNRLLTLATSKMDVKKAMRKTERAQMVINDPVRAAKRKLYKQDRKKVLKKRKIAISKTNKFLKKSNEVDLDYY